jgi:ankyrin repeat protein
MILLLACKAPEPQDIHAASKMGSSERIAKALELGADVNRLQDGITPLHAAVKSAKPEAVKVLLERGADPQLAGDQGLNPWQLLWSGSKTFMTSNEVACAIALLEGGVEIDHPKEGGSYLHLAAQRADNARLIKLLLDKEIPVEGYDEHGWTPLHIAAHRDHSEAAAALLGGGANPNVETAQTWEEVKSRGEDSSVVRFRYEAGSHPLDVARYSGGARGGKSVQALLKEWGGTKNPKVKNQHGP